MNVHHQGGGGGGDLPHPPRNDDNRRNVNVHHLHHPNKNDNAISQYDVLLVEEENELKFIPHNHIGNNRLNIFVKMHLHEFLSADDIDGQNQVIRNLAAVVERQCIDAYCQRAGRFRFCRVGAFRPEWLQGGNSGALPADDGDDVWTTLHNARVMEFLRRLLEQEHAHQAAIGSTTTAAAAAAAAPPPPPAVVDAVSANANVAATAAAMDKDDDDVKKRRRRSSLLRRSMSWGNVVDGQKKKILQRQSILMQLEQYDVSESDEQQDADDADDDSVVKRPPPPNADHSSSSSQSLSTTATAAPALSSTTTIQLPLPEGLETIVDDPTSSSSSLSLSPLEDITPLPEAVVDPSPAVADLIDPPTSQEAVVKPKAVTTAPTTTTNSTTASITSTTKSKPTTKRLERRSSFGDVPKKDASATIIHTANALDVLLERRIDGDGLGGNSYRLQRNHTGNNRLAVMIDLRSEKYKTIESSSTTLQQQLEVHHLCMDLVRAVSDHYHGRFLLIDEGGDNDKFLALTDEQAAAAIASIFKENNNARSASSPSARSDPTMAAATAAFSDSSSSLQSFGDASFSSLPANLQVPGTAHKAALASLHRRKKRNETSNKLSKIASRTQHQLPAPIPFLDSSGTDLRGPQQLMGARAASVGLLDTHSHYFIEQQQQQQQQDELYQPLRVQRRASSGMIYQDPRRSTLSNFSQEMIRDLLLQLDESHNNSAPVAGELDDLF